MMRGLCVVAVLAASGPAAAAVLDDPVLGPVHVAAPEGQPSGVMLLLSDGSGYDANERGVASRLLAQGDLVLGIDRRRLGSLAQDKGENSCTYLAETLEGLAVRVEHRRGMAPYVTPVLIGVGLGDGEAAALARETELGRIAGVVSMGSATPHQTALCEGEATIPSAPTTLRAISEAGMDADERIVAAANELIDAGGLRGPGDLSDLPLAVFLPQTRPQRFVVLLTGDGGLGAFDRSLASALVARGIGVAMLDSRRYFWAKRDPERTAQDLHRIIVHFRRDPGVGRLGLVGYSFGADYLPLAWAHLPERDRHLVAVVSLLALAPATDLGIQLRDEDYANDMPLLGAASQIDAHTLQCFYGRNDAAAIEACPALGALRPDTEILGNDGGHDFGGDVSHIAETIAAPLIAAPSLPRRHRHHG